jgi:hypothetical protein
MTNREYDGRNRQTLTGSHPGGKRGEITRFNLLFCRSFPPGSRQDVRQAPAAGDCCSGCSLSLPGPGPVCPSQGKPPDERYLGTRSLDALAPVEGDREVVG